MVEGEYFTGASEQLYIENNGFIGHYDPEEGVTVWGMMQCPYYVHPALCDIFKLPKTKVRVIQTETGGGFGGKEDYPTIDRRSRGALSLQIRRACQVGLRPRRRYGSHHEATSFPHHYKNRSD